MLTIYSFISVKIGSIREVFYIENSRILKKTKNVLHIYGKITVGIRITISKCNS